MAVELADAYISLVPSARGFGKALGSELGDMDGIGRDAGDRASKGFMGNFTSGLGGIALAVGGAFAAVGVGSFLKGTIDAASDLNETTSKVGVIFGDAAGTITKFASTSATALGQSKQQAMDAAATFATFGKSAGLTGEQLAGFSTGLVGTSADLASFFNTSPEQAIEAIGSALRGEAEPIRQYGILLDDATLRNRALKLGLISTTKDALTPANKVLAAQAEILAQTTDAQGDFARTSDGLANKQKILSAQFTDVKVKIGQGLLPIMSALVGFVSSSLLPAFTGIGERIGPIFQTVGLLFDSIKSAFSGEGVTSDGLFGVFERIGVVAREVFDTVSGAFKSFFATLTSGMTENDVATPIEKIAQVIRGVWEFLSSIDWGAVFGSIIDAVKPLVESVGSNLIAWWGLLLTAALTVFDLIKDNRSTLETLVGIIKDALTQAFSVASKAVDALSSVFNFLADHMGLVKAIVIPLAAAFLAYKIVMTGIAAVTWLVNTATAAWTAVQTAFNIVMALNPIGLVVAAIAALVVGVIYAYTHFETFRNIVDAAWQILQGVFHWITDHWPLLLAILLGPFGVALLLIIKNFDTIKDFIGGVISWIGDHWQLILAIITGPIGLAVLFITSNFDTIKDAFTAVKDWIGNKISDIVGFFTGLPGRIIGKIDETWEKIKLGFTVVKDWLWQKIEDIVGFFLGIPGRLANSFGGMFDGIADAFRGALNWVIGRWNGLEFKIPSFSAFGLSTPGFTLGMPDIPYLAAGGAATQATLAIIGEKSNRRNPEIAAPQSAIADAVAEALRQVGAGIGGGVTINATTMADAHDIGREVQWQMKTAGV